MEAALAAWADPSACCCDDIIRGRRAVMPLPAFCRSRFGEGSSRYPADDRRASASATCRRLGLPHVSQCFTSTTGELSCRTAWLVSLLNYPAPGIERQLCV